jgi:hypothetical protein
MRRNYRREDLGQGVRGKYHARYLAGSNLVLLDDRIAKAFPNAQAVNAALAMLLDVSDKLAKSSPEADTPAARAPNR